MSECHFYVGQKVVCTAKNPTWGCEERGRYFFFWRKRWIIAPFQPESPHIYKIVSIDPGREDDGIYLTFAEFSSESYDHRYFRPLVETKTDISIFEKILSDINAGKVKEVSVGPRERV